VKLVNVGLAILGVLSCFLPQVNSGTRQAFIPLLVIAGLAAAASGIAGAAQNSANLDAQAANSAADRAIQTKLAKQQIAEQKRQQNMNLTQQANSNEMQSLQQNADVYNQSAAQQQQAATDAQGTLARAFLRGRGG
jgi:hypothetical protein